MAAPADERARVNIPQSQFNHSLSLSAILQSGHDWEEEVIEKKISSPIHIADREGPIHTRTHTLGETLVALRMMKPGDYLYQPTIQMPDTLYEELGIDREKYAFPPCRPDLLYLAEIEGKPVLQVIDVKASDAMKASHRVQIALYALILAAIAEIEHLPFEVDLTTGFVWLYQADEPEDFDMDSSLNIVREFLQYSLDEIFTPDVGEVFWHLYFRCEWCEFYETCREEAERTRSISLIPYLSTPARKFLRNAEWEGGTPINTLSELKEFLTSPISNEVFNTCGSLRDMKDRMVHTVDALEKSEVILHGGSTIAFPKSEGVKIFLTLQEDPVTGNKYALGYRCFAYNSAIFGDYVKEYVRIASRPDDCITAQRDFLENLYSDLKAIADYNKDKDWNEQQSVQTYVFDPYELTLFNRLLFDSLKDPALAPIALHLLFHFQETVLSTTTQQPANEVPYPVIVLSRVIRDLAAIPVHVSYRLPDVLEYIPSPGHEFHITPRKFFWFHLSNIMKSDAIFKFWKTGDSADEESIRKEMILRIRGTASILDGIRSRVKDKLVTYPPKFSFPHEADFHHIELSQLGFIVRYESFMGAMKVREKRCLPISERIEKGMAIPLTYRYETLEGTHVFSLDVPLDEGIFESHEYSYSSILTDVSDKADLDQMLFNDYKHRKEGYLPTKSGNLISAKYVNPLTVDDDGFIHELEMQVGYCAYHTRFEEGEKAILHPRFTDSFSDPIFNQLITIDRAEDSGFLRLLRDPHAYSSPLSLDPAIREDALSYIRDADFMPSKNAAFSSVLSKKMTLIWGPPGTGKTHFLARSVVALLQAHLKEGKHFRVMVTAFTHAAIENLLTEIHNGLEEAGLLDSVLLGKLGKLVNLSADDYELIYNQGLAASASSEPHLILGGTVHKIKQFEGNLGRFDMLLIDETSQMKFGELALAIGSLRDEGRLVLAGDDLQLPPIIAGAYPESEDGLPGLHDSIFSYLRCRDEKQEYTCQLQENFRMNTTLSRFSASTLYGDGYIPATEKVAGRRLLLSETESNNPDDADELLRWVVDPDYPLVLCIIDHVQATVENTVEADITTRIVGYLKDRMVHEKTGEVYPDTMKGHSQFWGAGLFVVCPHHAQIRLIRKYLNREREWHHPPFVNTVDKMQGQESQVVIASYGVSDIETALSEANFIYSRNRLNVTLTRAKAKCIVFLSRPLMEQTYELLINKEAMEGMNHMINLRRFCAQNRDTRIFSAGFAPGGEGAEITVYRGRV